MGNTVVWKPASTAAVSAHFLMKLFEEAGLPPGVINLVYGSGAAVGDPALASEHLAGHPLHRLDARLPGDVEDGRRQHRALSQLSAGRRRDRRQGLHRRAPERRRRSARDRDPPRLLRVPGPEVLGGLARLRAREPVAAGARTRDRRDRRDEDGRRRRLLELRRRGDRRELLRDPEGGDRGGEGVRRQGAGDRRRQLRRQRRLVRRSRP